MRNEVKQVLDNLVSDGLIAKFRSTADGGVWVYPVDATKIPTKGVFITPSDVDELPPHVVGELSKEYCGIEPNGWYDYVCDVLL